MTMTSFRNVYVVVAPSGTGKTTLNNKMLEEYPEQIEMSVSYTTRDKRTKEINGIDYNFINKEEFERLVQHGDMLEWATVHGNLYGTPIQEINRISQIGKKILLEIDFQGWKQARRVIKDAVAVFIMPPSLEEMWRRLEFRGTDSLEVRWKRLQSARLEFEAAADYEYFLVNDSIENTYKELVDIIIHGRSPRLSKNEALQKAQKYIYELDHADWIHEIETQLKQRSLS